MRKLETICLASVLALGGLLGTGCVIHQPPRTGIQNREISREEASAIAFDFARANAYVYAKPVSTVRDGGYWLVRLAERLPTRQTDLDVWVDVRSGYVVDSTLHRQGKTSGQWARGGTAPVGTRGAPTTYPAQPAQPAYPPPSGASARPAPRAQPAARPAQPAARPAQPAARPARPAATATPVPATATRVKPVSRPSATATPVPATATRAPKAFPGPTPPAPPMPRPDPRTDERDAYQGTHPGSKAKARNEKAKQDKANKEKEKKEKEKKAREEKEAKARSRLPRLHRAAPAR